MGLEQIQLPAGFEAAELLYESERTIVVRARTTRGETRILKLLRSSCPRSRDVVAYKREYDITSGIERPHVVHADDLIISGRRPVLVLRDIGGVALDRVLQGEELSLVERLELAVQIAEAIAEIHAENVVHKDINPSNIVVNRTTGGLDVIDFGIATVLAHERASLTSPSVLEGTLPYISPEQTGRTNHAVDYRSDLYSFGITLYVLFTGRLPFTGDALALVYQHLTQPPVPPSEIDPGIPNMLSEIVGKLMAKAPEDRYQSAWGVKVDLEECLARLRSHDESSWAGPGAHDLPQQLRLSQKLYGRDAQLEELLAAFERVCQGEREAVFVAGYSGIGKTSLVHELFAPLTRCRGYFLTGKFDQLQRKVPFGGFTRALQDLVRQLLAESEDSLRAWRERIAEALGQNGQLIVDILPELELIVGRQPPVPELAPLESRNRFTLVVERFIRALCSSGQPLVVFLDDLQWSDDATLELLELLMTGDCAQLLLIGAYRDNEVPPEHPLARLQKELARKGARLRTIALGPLALDDVAALLRDSLHRDTDTVMPLARVVLAKTGGNPFFVVQFLSALYEDGLLSFCHGDVAPPGWRWNMAGIERSDITDNVVDLMVRRLRKLPAETLRVVELAACLGSDFDLATLALVERRPIATTYSALYPAIQEGVLVPTKDLELLDPDDVHGPVGFTHCRFLHDRVREAAYGMIDDTKKPSIHLDIGRLLLARVDDGGAPKELFELVDHLNLGRELLCTVEERMELARLDLEAARRAKLATAYDAALQYVARGMSTFGGDWKEHYALTFAQYRERAELEYLCGNHARAEAMIAEVWERATDLDRAETQAQLVTQYTLLGRNDDAIRTAAKALELVGVRFPAESELDDATAAVLDAIEKTLEHRTVASLANLPPMTDRRVMVAMKLLMTVHTATFFANRYRIYSWVLATMTMLSIQYGNVPASAKGYASFGNTLAANHGLYERGFELGKLGLSLAQKYDDDSLRCKTCLILSMFLNHWVQPIAMAEAFDEEGLRAGMAAGELQFIGYLLFYGRTANRFHASEPLDELSLEARRHLAFSRKVDHRLSTDNLLGALLVMSNLVGATANASSFDLDELVESDYLRQCAEHESFPAICFYETTKAFTLYLHGDIAAALQAIDDAAPLVGYIKGVLTEAAHTFYDALIVAEASTEASTEQRRRYDERLAEDLRRLREWAQHCPSNFLHQCRLIEAEVARLAGDTSRAASLYDEAITAAADNGFTQDRALANELAARLWLSNGNGDLALRHLRSALACYRAWGAKRKQALLVAAHPALVVRHPPSRTTSSEAGVEHGSLAAPTFFTERTLSATLDLASAFKACRAISREIDLDLLLDRLLEILLESAGAERALAMMTREGQLRVVASATTSAGVRSTTLCDILFEDSTELPRSIVQYVSRTRSTLVLRDAAREGSFTADPYVRRSSARSILCLPIVTGGNVTAILYLENARMSGAFSPDRVELLEMLAGQAAIALQNASLLAMERAARANAEEAERRTAFFSETTRVLTESLEYEEVLDRLARLVVTHLSDWCVIDVLEGDRVRRLAGDHADPSRRPLLHDLQARHPSRLDSPHPATRAIQTRRPVLIADASADALRAVCEDEDHVRIVEALGTSSILVVPLMTRGRVLGALTLCSASPARQYGEPEVEMAQEVANRAAIAIENARLFRQSQDAVRIRDEFVMVASHELRTPITPLKLQIELIRKLVDQASGLPNRHALLSAIERSGKRIEGLEQLVENLLDMSRISAGRLVLHRERVDLAEVVRKTVEDYAPASRLAACDLAFHADGPVVGDWDRTRIEQVAVNLLSNALKYGARHPIEVSVSTVDGDAVLVVRDHGIGIAKEDQARLGERFARAASVHHYGGFGLGLYISREIVLAHEGVLRFESEVGEGTSFIVTLPLRAAGTRDLEPAPDDATGWTPARARTSCRGRATLK